MSGTCLLLFSFSGFVRSTPAVMDDSYLGYFWSSVFFVYRVAWSMLLAIRLGCWRCAGANRVISMPRFSCNSKSTHAIRNYIVPPSVRVVCGVSVRRMVVDRGRPCKLVLLTLAASGGKGKSPTSILLSRGIKVEYARTA